MAQADPDEEKNSTSEGTEGGAGDAARSSGEEAEYIFEEDLDEEELDESEPVETIDEQGRRHIRRAAPEGTEQILEHEAPRRTGLSDRAERWRMRSATGTVLTAFAFGLKEVFEPNRNEPAVIMETSGDPPRDLPVEAELEQLGPRQSKVVVRSWLLEGDPSTKSRSPEAFVAGDGREGSDQASGGSEAQSGDAAGHGAAGNTGSGAAGNTGSGAAGNTGSGDGEATGTAAEDEQP